jgi:hypothetical protein
VARTKRRRGAHGGSVENQARAVYSQDLFAGHEDGAGTRRDALPEGARRHGERRQRRRSPKPHERRAADQRHPDGTLVCLRCCFLRLTFAPGSAPPGTTKRAATRDIAPARQISADAPTLSDTREVGGNPLTDRVSRRVLAIAGVATTTGRTWRPGRKHPPGAPMEQSEGGKVSGRHLRPAHPQRSRNAKNELQKIVSVPPIRPYPSSRVSVGRVCRGVRRCVFR